MSDILYIDLETLQATDPDIISDVIANIKAPSNYKKQDVIDKYIEAHKEEAISKTSFDGWAGSICSIAWAVNNEPVRVLYRSFNDSEHGLIERFWDSLVNENSVNFSPLWVAHNIEFDMHFLYKRMVVNNIPPPIHFPVMPKAWDRDCFCTMHNSTAGKPGGSLARIAKVLGLEGKLEGMDGSMVNQYFLDGREKEIAEYNKRDVEVTRNIYKRLNFIDNIVG